MADEAEEIEIMPEMVEAGVAVLTASGRVSPNLVDWAADGLVRDIYEAMASLDHSQGKPLFREGQLWHQYDFLPLEKVRLLNAR